jgi:hypothetical protein
VKVAAFILTTLIAVLLAIAARLNDAEAFPLLLGSAAALAILLALTLAAITIRWLQGRRHDGSIAVVSSKGRPPIRPRTDAKPAGEVVGTIRSFSVPTGASEAGASAVEPARSDSPRTSFGTRVPEPPAKLPKRLRGLKAGELSTYGWKAIIARQRLVTEGGRIKGQVNQAASATDAPGVEPAVDELRRDVEAWEGKVRDFDAEWDWGEADLLKSLFDNAEAAVDAAIVPRPEWRARLQGRLDAGLEWLSDHYIDLEAVGLSTERVQ